MRKQFNGRKLNTHPKQLSIESREASHRSSVVVKDLFRFINKSHEMNIKSYDLRLGKCSSSGGRERMALGSRCYLNSAVQRRFQDHLAAFSLSPGVSSNCRCNINLKSDDNCGSHGHLHNGTEIKRDLQLENIHYFVLLAIISGHLSANCSCGAVQMEQKIIPFMFL